MKYSKQRELILKTVMEHMVHPDADCIYSLLCGEYPNLSLGTVYGNLNILSQNGMIRKLAMPYGSDRFDGRTDDHCHMACGYCGKVLDAEIGDIVRMGECIRKNSGFEVQRYELVFCGTCRECYEAAKCGESR